MDLPIGDLIEGVADIATDIRPGRRAAGCIFYLVLIAILIGLLVWYFNG